MIFLFSETSRPAVRPAHSPRGVKRSGPYVDLWPPSRVEVKNEWSCACTPPIYLHGLARDSFAFVCFWRDSPQWAMAPSFTRFIDHTQRRTTVGRTPLDEWLAHRRDLYLTTHNTHNRQTSMPPVGFEPTISAGERPQTYALDRAATGTGIQLCLYLAIFTSVKPKVLSP